MRKSKWSKIAVHMCQIYKLKLPNEVVPALSWEFSHHKNPKNKNGLTSLHLETFPNEFTLVKMQQSFEVELIHGLTPLHFGCFPYFPKNQFQKEYKMANYLKSSKCVILS